MVDIEIKRGYEVLPDNNIRFGVRVINNSDFAISDVEVILDYSMSIFELKGHKIENLGTIPPKVQRTAKFILKPRSCARKEHIGAMVIYKDHQWNKHTEEMRPKEVPCVIPFLKEKSITRADFLRLSNSGSLEERGVNFDGITVDKLVDFIDHTCKNRLYKVDEFPIENGKILYLAGDAVGEKAYYLLTAVVKEHEGLPQVLLRATSDKSYGLNGFLNEILENLRHLVISASAREIGIIKKEQVIKFFNSVWIRPTIEVEGTTSVEFKESVVTRPMIKGDEGRKRRGEERLWGEEREEQEKLRRQRAEEEKAQIEEQERLHREEERREKETKAREEWERKAREDAERREREQKARQEENLRRQQEDWERTAREREEPARKEPEVTSGKGFLAVVLLLGVVLLGYWALAPGVTKSTPFPFPDPPAGQNTFTNSIGVEFLLIPAGEFNMGLPESWVGSWGSEVPVHRVKIANTFYMGKYEVTQKQWREIMGNDPSYFKGDNLPVEDVSWNDVHEFIKKLNKKEGTNKYRLPSEAEWEYAARAGTLTGYSFGNDDSKLGDYAWHSGNSGDKTHEVGQKKPNPWGLYDVDGNVKEWVEDSWHSNYNGAPTDGSAWEGDGSFHVVRGGGYDCYASGLAYGRCWSAIRSSGIPDFRGAPGFGHGIIGFRLLRIS